MEYSYVYMMTTLDNSALYIGVTTNLEKRVLEHRNRIHQGSFTDRYNCHKLVYFERCGCVKQAIDREKQLKSWRRSWKNKLIDEINPEWRDLMG